MKEYPNHSVVRIHTDTLEIIKKLSKEMKVKPPEVIDRLVDYFIKQERERINSMEGDRYYQLQDQAHGKWMEAQELISRAEYLFEHGKIDEADWYRMLADARSLQEKAIELFEKVAIDAQVLFWREKFDDISDRYSEMLDAKRIETRRMRCTRMN